MVSLLYNDQFAPITSSIGFLDADLRRVVDTYLSWSAKIKKKLRIEEVTAPLNAALTRLLPLTSRERRRFLFVPTASPWTAYLDNSVLGSDVSPTMSHMAKLLGSRTLRMTAISEEREKQRQKGRRNAAVILEIFEAQQTDWLNIGRSITMMNDGRWIFELGGKQQPFEEPENYSMPQVKERFTLDMLDRYLCALGIRAFEESFYLPKGTNGVLLHKEGLPVAGMKEFTLEQSFARHT